MHIYAITSKFYIRLISYNSHFALHFKTIFYDITYGVSKLPGLESYMTGGQNNLVNT